MMNRLKTWMIASVTLLTLASVNVEAQNGSSCDTGCPKERSCEPKKSCETNSCDPCEWDCDSRWDQNTGPHLRSAHPMCANDWTFFSESEVLIWDTYNTDLDFAMDGFEGTSDDMSSTPLVGNVHFLDFGWDIGVRSSLGVITPCDGFEFKVVYTYFNPSDSKTVLANEDAINPNKSSHSGVLWPLFWIPAEEDDEANGAFAKMSMDYHVIDILAGRPSFVSEHIAISPFFGVRVLILDQSMHAEYFDGEFSSQDEESLSQAIVNWNSDFTGAGIHAGSKMEWHFGCGFTFFGQAAGSVIAGSSDIHHFGTAKSDTILDLKECKDSIKTNMEGRLGFAWEKSFNNCLKQVKVHAAYELTHWFNVDKARRFYAHQGGSSGESNEQNIVGSSSSSDRGSLGFHGVSVGVDFWF